MADVVIRGIEMPNAEGCEVIIRIQPNGEVLDAHKIHIGATAIPLPEGHGKLIDIEDVKSEKFHIEGRAEMYSAYNIGWNDALDAVCMNAPSIVPAEGGTDECSEN